MTLYFVALNVVVASGFLVVIDPGHGGKDPGAIGIDNIKEKDITLALSMQLQKKLNRLHNVSARLTRDKDIYLTLSERRHLAEKMGADLLVSIHADSFRHNRANGMSVYALSSKGATSFAAEFLANQENASISSGHQQDDIDDVLLDLKQSSSIQRSLAIGEDLLQALKSIGSLHSGHVEQAAFVVLKSPHYPSVLVESGFISNPGDAKQLNSQEFQDVLTTSLASGINIYLSDLAEHSLYEVVPGDSLYVIAQKKHTSIQSLRKLNKLNDDIIYPGMKLRLH